MEMSPTQAATLRQAVAHHQAGDLERAILAYRQVLAARPRDADALHMLGVALAQTGRPADALPFIQAALETYPDNAMVHLNLGNTLKALQRQSEALACYRRAAELAPERIEIHEAMCQVAVALGEHADVLTSTDRALALRPDDAALLLCRASALLGLDRAAEALACCDRAATLRPDLWDVHTRRGISLAKLQRLAEAEQSFTRATALNPTNALLHCYLGNLYVTQGRHAQAVASLERALELKPDDLDARWNLALVRLTRGEFRQGFELYELRFALDGRRGYPKRFVERPWTGREDLRGKRILLWSERGLGDTLQFSRYALLVRDLGADVTIEVQAPLRALLESQFPGVRVVGRDEPVPDFDYQCSLLSVAGVLGTQPDTIPADVPYLVADRAAVERWSVRLPTGDTLRVGIAWQGNLDAERNWASGRSWPLEALEPLSRQPGVCLISLQTGRGAEQVASVPFADRIVSFGEELDAGPHAFLDTAAIMMSLDLVITTDTSVAHLAGALGVPVWVALHTTSEWRWLLEREDSPWYPTMRLFRQRAAGDWESVVADICRALATVAPSRKVIEVAEDLVIQHAGEDEAARSHR
jgi:tetratricopeptide (TPR) repeat protein